METSEVLVHVSAPSTAADDARYRAQVQAILGFQPVSCQVITLRSDEASSDLSQGQDQSHRQSPDRPHADDTRHRDADAHGSPSAAPLPCTSQATSDLDPHVIPSPNDDNDIIPSTTFIAATGPSLPGGAAQDSLGSPVSVIPDSQPERPVSDNAIGFESSGQYRRTSPDPSSPLPSKRRRISPDRIPDQPSDLPDGPPLAEREGEEDKDKQKQGPQEKQNSHQSDHARRPPSHPPPSPKPKATASPKPPDKGKGKDNKTPSLRPAPVLILPPMQIRPPPPPISNKKFTTHITPTLAMLFNRLHSPRIYTPAQQSRSLDILERGYWYLRINILHADADTHTDAKQTKPDDPNTWAPSLFNRFWSFLSEFVGKEGRAGWGVWCLLEDTSPSSRPDSDPTSETQSTTQTDSSASTTSQHAQIPKVGPLAHELGLKVYAWGEVAVHIYLLLFLASERRIRKMGAQWYDGSGEVVIRMPGLTSSAV